MAPTFQSDRVHSGVGHQIPERRGNVRLSAVHEHALGEHAPELVVGAQSGDPVRRCPLEFWGAGGESRRCW